MKPVAKKKQAIKVAEQKKKSREQKPNAIDANLQTLNERFDGIKSELAKIIESSPKMSLFRHLLRVESVIGKIKEGAYVLKINAEGKGTNIITKFLWSTTIKHSAFVEARYQLFDSQGVLIKSDATQKYSSLKKSKEI